MNAANTITVFRLFAVIPFAIFLAKKNYLVALIFFIFAGLSDLVDGFIARKFNQITKLGGFLDPLADKLLIFAGNLLFVLQSVIPLWFFILIILKDLSILIGVVLLKSRGIDWEPKPNRCGKISAFLQGIIILFAVLDQGFFNTGPLILITIAICTAFIILSWFYYYKFYSQLNGGTNNAC